MALNKIGILNCFPLWKSPFLCNPYGNCAVPEIGLWHCPHFTHEQIETGSGPADPAAHLPGAQCRRHRPTTGRQPAGGVWGCPDPRGPSGLVFLASVLTLTRRVPQRAPHSRAVTRSGACAERPSAQWQVTRRPGPLKGKNEESCAGGWELLLRPRLRQGHCMCLKCNGGCVGPWDAKQKMSSLAVTLLILYFPKGCSGGKENTKWKL